MRLVIGRIKNAASSTTRDVYTILSSGLVIDYGIFTAMVATSPYQCLTLSLLILPPLLLTAYFMAVFPSPPAPIFIHPSLASLPPTSKSWSIYPEEFYPGGGYAAFPNGKVRSWVLIPLAMCSRYHTIFRLGIGFWVPRRGRGYAKETRMSSTLSNCRA